MDLIDRTYWSCTTLQAVCCSDERHCCPNGYTCDTSGGKCEKGNSVMEWLTKVKAVKTELPEQELTPCPGGQVSCKSGQTCCKTATGYGCCPRPNVS